MREEPMNELSYDELKRLAKKQLVDPWKSDLVYSFFNDFCRYHTNNFYPLLMLFEIGRIIGIREERQRKKPLIQSHLPKPIV